MFFCTVYGSFPLSQFLRIDPIPFIQTAQKTGSRNSSLCTNRGFDQKMSIHKTLICRKLCTRRRPRSGTSGRYLKDHEVKDSWDVKNKGFRIGVCNYV